ncbi:MerR family transcriptional regulator [Nocardia sp. NPDC055049]
MRIGELSARSGVSISTIKYYIRERLLAPGELSRSNRASYNSTHLHRLRLIAALSEVGGLSIATLTEVLGAVDRPDLSMGASLRAALTWAHNTAVSVDDDEWHSAHDEVEELLGREGLDGRCAPTAMSGVVGVVVQMRRLGYQDWGNEAIGKYAKASKLIAAKDVDYVFARGSRSEQIESAVITTVLGEAMLLAIRKIAHQSVQANRCGNL